ncbi:hypothetical protein [Marinicella sp. W31]|uniref:hypothetical protein n=1 Tax=Marinicella sp. W31 TaxID=3023713 RepID=UPI0037582D9A
MKRVIIFILCLAVVFQAMGNAAVPPSIANLKPTGVSDLKWNALLAKISKGAGTKTKLIANDGDMGDRFGGSVSLWGNRALVGAPNNDTIAGKQSGEVYVFDFDTTTGWTLTTKLNASAGGAFDHFGTSVSLWGDRALIGAPFYNGSTAGSSIGAAYVFDFDSATGKWSETIKLTGLDFEADSFSQFGVSVSLHEDRALVGAPGADVTFNGKEGVADIFEYDAKLQQWSHITRMTRVLGETGDDFGGSVSLHGNQALIGAKGVSLGRGAAYVFKFNSITGQWPQNPTYELTANDGNLLDRFGGSISLWGDKALIGAATADDIGEESGAVYIFVFDIKSGWNQFRKVTAIDGGPFDLFGSSVSLHENLFVVGAESNSARGAVYLFDLSGITSSSPIISSEKYTVSDGRSGDLLGSSVSLWAGRSLLGAPEADGRELNTGAAYVFVADVIFIDGFD